MSAAEQDLLADAVDAVDGCRTLEEALSRLVGVLQGPFELWQATIHTLLAGRPTVRVLAHWSVVETPWEADMEVSTSITPTVAEGVGLLERDEVVYATVSTGEESLVNHLMREQGVAAVLAMPLHQESGETLVLSLGSSSESVLKAVPISFCRGLAAGIGERMYALSHTPSL